MRNAIERHVVLVSPDVHWNTGNIGRTCLGAGARLHLIEPLGFSLDDKAVKRAGLDYWPRVDVTVWPDFSTFTGKMKVSGDEMVLLTKRGERPYWELPPHRRLVLVFGSETRGLPEGIIDAYPGRTFHIPITGDIRSLNLSTAAGIVLYESLRRTPPLHAW